ncbi:uncharacterized protein LOC123854150 isoform X1 [Mirounga angustirostris]|uniref:uncharacterized protein LOC123854150 isoform X1 n=1 Tax=Mirounga angustirostris TaxID=9716 RepID=UPI00313ED3A1
MKVPVAVARARAAAVEARGEESSGGRRGACELRPLPAPGEVAARPGLLYPAKQSPGWTAENKKMDSQLQSAISHPMGGPAPSVAIHQIRTEESPEEPPRWEQASMCTSRCQNLQPVGGRQHQRKRTIRLCLVWDFPTYKALKDADNSEPREAHSLGPDHISRPGGAPEAQLSSSHLQDRPARLPCWEHSMDSLASSLSRPSQTSVLV